MFKKFKGVRFFVSVILTFAICITTLYGAVLTASALITVGSSDGVYYVDVPDVIRPYGDTFTAYITLSRDGDKFDRGTFTLLENFIVPRDDEIQEVISELGLNISVQDYKNGSHKTEIDNRLAMWQYEFSSVTVTPHSGTPRSGVYSASDFTITNTYGGGYDSSPRNTNRHQYDRLSDVEFRLSQEYTSVTLRLDYRYEYHIGIERNSTAENSVRVAHSDLDSNECYDGGEKLKYQSPRLIDMTSSSVGLYHEASQTYPADTIDYVHAHTWQWNESDIIYDADYPIYNAKCTECDVTQHQMGSKEIGVSTSHPYYEVLGVNVQYEDNGTVSINVHVPYTQSNEELVICAVDGTKTKYGSIVVTPENQSTVLQSSYYAKKQSNDDAPFPMDTKMYTLKGISASDLKKEVFLTRMVDGRWVGTSHRFSLEEYAVSVINEQNVYYPEATTQIQKEADKQVAAAFVNYAVNAANALNGKIVSSPKHSVNWSRKYTIKDEAAFLASLQEGGNGTADKPYIITTPEQMMYLACYAGDNSAGKFYMVSDSISEFNMGAYDYEDTASEIEQSINKTWGAHNNNSTSLVNNVAVNNFFQGTFDGNGVVIYGLDGRAWQTGLFPKVAGNVTIKGLTVLSSSFIVTGTNSGAGAIVGTTDNDCNLTIEKCAAKWCWFDSENMNASMGALVGYLAERSHASIVNCAVVENIFDADYTQLWPYGGIIGHAGSNGNEYRSILALGNAPYSTVHGDGEGYNPSRPNSENASSRWANTFRGVYTDQPAEYFGGYYMNGDRLYVSLAYPSEIKQLTNAEMIGKDVKSKMPYLDWSQWFVVADDYPHMVTFFSTSQQTDKLLVWDGTFDTTLADKGETGIDAEHPIIIDNPEELAYLVSGAGAKGTDGSATKGKYYKVADGIGEFDMNGFKDVNLESTVENVKAARKTGDEYNWGKLNPDYDNSAWFAGHFDGNYVRIYNLYGRGISMGLFPFVNNTASIKNVSVERSFIEATKAGGNYGAGGLVGAIRATYMDDPHEIIIENCTVRDSYICNTNTTDTDTTITAAHAVGSATWVTVKISNSFFANNILDVSEAKTADDKTSTTIGGIVGADTSQSVITAELTAVVHINHISSFDSPLISASFIGSYQNYKLKECYTTDPGVSNDFDGVSVLVGGYNDILGGNAIVNMPTLAWGVRWFAGTPGKYPMLYDDGTSNIPPTILSNLNSPLYNGDTKLLEGWDIFEASYDTSFADHSFTTTDQNIKMYSSGLNLKDNPYLLLTLEINGKYRNEKENVVATFKVGEQEFSVKASEMTNNEGAGRYHLVRLKQIYIKNLHKTVDVTISYNGEQILQGTLSVAGFIYKANRSGPQYENYAIAGKALIYYSQALNARAQIRNG